MLNKTQLRNISSMVCRLGSPKDATIWYDFPQPGRLVAEFCPKKRSQRKRNFPPFKFRIAPCSRSFWRCRRRCRLEVATAREKTNLLQVRSEVSRTNALIREIVDWSNVALFGKEQCQAGLGIMRRRYCQHGFGREVHPSQVDYLRHRNGKTAYRWRGWALSRGVVGSAQRHFGSFVPPSTNT